MFRERSRAGARILVALCLLAGCGRHASVLEPAVEPEKLEIQATRLAEDRAGGFSYRVSWTSGSVRSFLYAVNPADPGQVDPSWIRSGEHSVVIHTPARSRMQRERGEAPTLTRFVIRAVDARGGRSDPQVLAFLDGLPAPNAFIYSPVPQSLSRTYLPPTFDAHWAGTTSSHDPLTRPSLFKWKLLTAWTGVPYHIALANPDSVRRFYAPGGYADWDSAEVDLDGLGGATFRDLAVSQDYILVLVVRDEHGVWSHNFYLDQNMLNFRVVPPGVAGPLLSLFNESFTYTYSAPTLSIDSRYEIPLIVSPGTRVTVNWSAVPNPGSRLAGFRWGVDLADPMGESSPASGSRHAGWTPLRLENTSAEIGPFGPNETHRLYVEARDVHGLRSLGIVRIQTIESSARRPLLIVDDTRFNLDERRIGQPCMSPPLGPWPTAAELDTFLYARGGVPWRCYPAGTVSSPGLFAGYDCDTLGTRRYPGGTIPLSVLSRYDRVLWLTDAHAAVLDAPLTNPFPITALRYMSQPGRQNSLAEYVRGGGNLWVAGGGAVYASTIPYNRLSNDTQGWGARFSRDLGELGPGRFAHDVLGWRSEVTVNNLPVALSRYLGRFEGRASDYSGLPPSMRTRTPATDPFPPGRSPTPGVFYVPYFNFEYLSQPNALLNSMERGEPGIAGSSLDTLYQVQGAGLPTPEINPHNVVMTRYHGAFRHRPVIFTGFDLWTFRRQDCKALVDFVLQDLWGMPAPAAPPIAVAEADPPVRRPQSR